MALQKFSLDVVLRVQQHIHAQLTLPPSEQQPAIDLSERAIARNEIVVRSRVIGGLQMIDDGEADDKIISVLENDYVWGGARNMSDVPSVLVERLQHYFLTYKLVPRQRSKARIASVYGRVHALKVVRAAMADYDNNFP